MKDSQETIIFWIDANIENKKYTHYKKELEDSGYHVDCFSEINEAIPNIKVVHFQKVKIIINSNLFANFLKKFKNEASSIFVIPKIIVFTENKEDIKEINKNEEEKSIYAFGGTVSSFDEIKAFITDNIISTKFIDVKEPQLTFEYIDREEKLALQLFYKTLIKIEDFNKIQNFTNEIYKKYCNPDEKENKGYKDLKEIFGQMISMPISNIPKELLSKYYARAYTVESKFYGDLNKDLRENKKDNYLPLIKLFYESILRKTFKLSANVDLYRGTIIKNEEITKIQNYKNKPNENENLPGTVFSRTFLSFSKSRKVAHKFLKKCESDNEFSKVLFILEKNNDIDYDLATHCDIEDISLFPDEKEVLFLPFSPFKIIDIYNEKIKDELLNEEIYVIKLAYLDKKSVKYLEDYAKLEKNEILKENKEEKNEEEKEKENEEKKEKEKRENKNILKKEIAEKFEFRKQIIQSGLIDEEDIGDIDYLFQKYKEYKELLDKGVNIIISKKNVIIGEINIPDYIINKEIRIINSFESSGVDHNNIKNKEEFKNAKEIKKSVTIKIDGQQIDFSYSYKFPKKGKYKIKYIFSQNLTKIDYIFSNCKLLTKLDLSNFDTSSVINMSGMFNGCTSLIEINLSKFNTKNVFNMRRMFYGCKSLKSLNLSYFDTRNVIDMSDMFKDCISLISLNLTNFITKKVRNMSNMFNGCSSLSNLNLSNFDVEKVNVMWKMFHGCKSLKDKNIQNKSLKLLNELKNIELV